MNSIPAIWVVIPAFNEGAVVGNVVQRVRAHYANVLVVDDCSSDESGLVARRAGAIVLRHPVNLGAGAATETGIRFALSQGADFVVTIDADGQHRVEDIEALLNKQRESQADVVIGSRFLGEAVEMPMLRRVLLKLAALFTRFTTGLAISDSHNGLRVFTRSAAQRIQIRQHGFAHASEIIHQIRALGLSLAEAPVTVLYTKYSLRKGQRLLNAVNIVWELLLSRLTK